MSEPTITKTMNKRTDALEGAADISRAQEVETGEDDNGIAPKKKIKRDVSQRNTLQTASSDGFVKSDDRNGDEDENRVESENFPDMLMHVSSSYIGEGAIHPSSGIDIMNSIDSKILLNVKPIDLTSPFVFGEGTAFGLEAPTRQKLLPDSAGCCADRISFCAHASGTHTECSAHINLGGDFNSIFEEVPPFSVCMVLRVIAEPFGSCGGDTYELSVPEPSSDDLVISRRGLEKALLELGVRPTKLVTSALLMSLETKWVFLTDQAMDWLISNGIISLLIDKVSVDREQCGPKMPAHRRFFSRPHSLITENVRQDKSIRPGIYYLNLQLSPFLGTDAVPSRVLLYPIE